MTLTASPAVPTPRFRPAASLPLWLVTMPTTGPTGTRGEQTFAIRALTCAEALTAAATTAHTHPALRHRRGAHIDTTDAHATLHH
ncbi:hypothetical protein [Kitasatospora cineracea]|uniref:hypothetical protein n=1 Tax=Kitasatospora cineracea TaxID=88074 RepID=UPI0037F9EC3F